MPSNKYLIQALRAYREEVAGQYGEITEREVEITRDAADEMERLNAEVESLKQGVTIKFDPDCEPGLGLVGGMTWGTLKRVIEEAEDDTHELAAITVDEHRGLMFTWGDRIK